LRVGGGSLGFGAEVGAWRLRAEVGSWVWRLGIGSWERRLRVRGGCRLVEAESGSLGQRLALWVEVRD